MFRCFLKCRWFGTCKQIAKDICSSDHSLTVQLRKTYVNTPRMMDIFILYDW